jgi:predicted permease
VFGVLFLLAAGAALVRWGPLEREQSRILDRFAVTLSLPALTISKLSGMKITSEMAVPVAIAWGQLAVAATAVIIVAKLFRWERRTLFAALLVTPLGNTSFVGIPLIRSLLGADHIPHAIVYDQLGSFLALATYGTMVVAIGTAKPGGPAVLARQALRRLFTFPPFYGLLLALCLAIGRWQLPGWLEDPVDLLAATLIPITLTSVGMRLRAPSHITRPRPLAWVLGLRLVAIPALVALVATAVHGTSQSWQTARLESAMPPQITASIIAAEEGFDEELAVNAAGLGILIGIVTTFLWSRTFAR